jgi:galactonate dehydratase
LSEGAAGYRWSAVYPCLYSTKFETALVRVETDQGIAGWGEAQAPLVPEVACTIVELLLAPILLNQSFDGAPERIAELWEMMYSAMRVRGQTGGFMLDAISAVDIALWDIAGQLARKPISALLSPAPKSTIPAYLSGMPHGATDSQGFTKVKLFYDTHTPEEFFEHVDAQTSQVAVDALWRHTPDSALAFGRELEKRNALWFEAPLPPKNPAHGELARALRRLSRLAKLPHAMKCALLPQTCRRLPPDIGRCGIAEVCVGRPRRRTRRRCRPHTIAFGPQVAAALHFAAAVANCPLAEYNPQVLAVANRFLVEPLVLKSGSYVVPRGPGLGIQLRDL